MEPMMTRSITPVVANSTWSPAQVCYRRLMVALREAYVHDRAKLFWARHRVKVEMHKYASLEPASPDARGAIGIGHEVARFVDGMMRFSVQRVLEHNELVAKLPIKDAKLCRERYLVSEHEHEVWCKQRIRAMLRRRPMPPYPYC
jgi:hypothetical protein